MCIAESMREMCHKNVALDGQRSLKVYNAIQQKFDVALRL
jgi:hypothetical protein